MANVLRSMNAGGLLPAGLAGEVAEVAETALVRHAARLELGGVDVAMYVTPWTLPETGVGGYAPLPYWMQVTLSPGNSKFTERWRVEVPATLAHELHHVRRRRGPGYGGALLAALASEGLAIHVEAEERGALPPYADIHEDLEPLSQRAQAEPDSGTYDHAA